MTLRRFALALAAVLAFHAAPALADDDDIYKPVKDTKGVTLDPEGSYLVVQTNSDSSMFSFGLAFLRRPEQADIEDYVRRRKEALDKAHAKWEDRHRRWETALAAWEKLSESKRRRTDRPVEPVEPTDANLAFAPIDKENMLPIGPFNRFSKANDRSTFIQRVKPGRYAFYGSLIFGNGVGGTCMCMGTFEFDIAPGQIVYAGMMTDSWLVARAKAKEDGVPVPKTPFDLPEDVSGLTWDLPTAGEIDDPRLAAYNVVPAELHAAGRIPNYYGVAIDRLTAIPGILEYRRDTVIDGRTGEPVAAAAIGR